MKSDDVAASKQVEGGGEKRKQKAESRKQSKGEGSGCRVQGSGTASERRSLPRGGS
jgi:hypothetical protein